MGISTTEEIIEEFRNGRMAVVMDDEGRENEGDIIIPAKYCDAAAINFMATHGKGLICLALSADRCKRLGLGLMVDKNRAPFSTAFTVSIEAAEGVTTGISAADRARTVAAATAPDATASDIVQPGHVFPLIAQEGGVLTRTGHTEASTDFARLAGCDRAAVICEIMNEDGSMARRDDLEKFCEKHGLKLGTVADLVEYRMKHETTVREVSRCKLPTRHGEFTMVNFEDTVDGLSHFALVSGDLAANAEPIVRVHLHEYFSDVLESDRIRKQSFTLDKAMETIAKKGGVLLVMNTSVQNADLSALAERMAAEDQGETVPQGPKKASKRVGTGSQILKKLGITRMKLMSTQTKYHGLSGYGLTIAGYVDADGNDA